MMGNNDFMNAGAREQTASPNKSPQLAFQSLRWLLSRKKDLQFGQAMK
jgi:hypothetical protein